MLTNDRRTQLDGILIKMKQNNESEDAIQFVVNDFKNKYSVSEPETSFAEKTASVLDAFFGGGKVGEAIGTGLAKGKFGKSLQKLSVGSNLTDEEESFVTPAPSVREVAGSALQSAALFAPVGTMAKGITGGARALGMARGASALGKIGSGVLAGEMFDVASNLQQGKTGKDALTPGIGALIGGVIPGAGVAKNVAVRFGNKQSPRIINSLIKPLAKDFSYGKNPGRAVAEEGIVANNFDDLIEKIRASRQKIGQEIGTLGDTLSTRPILSIRDALSPLDDAAKVAASQNNQILLSRLNNVKRALTEVLEPTIDDSGNLSIKSVGSRDLENITFKQVRNFLGDVGDLTAFTGNPSDDKIINSSLKKVYGGVKEKSLGLAREINPSLAKNFEKLTEKYGDLTSAEIATKYRDKIIERQALIGMSPRNIGIGTGIITAVVTGGATIPAVLAGVSAGVLDKIMTTPAFKTRLAYILSKKTQGEVNYLLKKIPALKSLFSTKTGLTPGDVLLGKNAKKVEEGITDFIKNPKLGASIQDVSKGAYKGEKDLTTKILKDLEGKTTVSKQYILDATNRGELKQVERDLIRQALTNEGDTINVANFAKKVKAELLPLKTQNLINPKYERITLPSELRGNVKNYSENIYESPIKTSAGDVHFPSYGANSRRAGTDSSQNYFGHTRIEDMADNKTRRVIEVQSDLYQKGNLENSLAKAEMPQGGVMKKSDLKGLKQLQQYNDPTAHFRMVREEIKKASQDGKTKLQFPTGETAMKIEGLGQDGVQWWQEGSTSKLSPDTLKVGMDVVQGADGSNWIITDVLGDGKFKALPKQHADRLMKKDFVGKTINERLKDSTDKGWDFANRQETFDISGKVDTNNPIYKFYEKEVQKYLNKFGGKRIVDDKGVSWIEIPIKKEWAKMPVEAFALLFSLTGGGMLKKATEQKQQ